MTDEYVAATTSGYPLTQTEAAQAEPVVSPDHPEHAGADEVVVPEKGADTSKAKSQDKDKDSDKGSKSSKSSKDKNEDKDADRDEDKAKTDKPKISKATKEGQDPDEIARPDEINSLEVEEGAPKYVVVHDGAGNFVRGDIVTAEQLEPSFMMDDTKHKQMKRAVDRLLELGAILPANEGEGAVVAEQYRLHRERVAMGRG